MAIGTENLQGSPQQELFELLRNLDFAKVIQLNQYFTKNFLKENILDKTVFNKLDYGSVARLTFEPERFMAMCLAVQDAVKKVAAMRTGLIYNHSLSTNWPVCSINSKCLHWPHPILIKCINIYFFSMPKN